MEERIRYFGYYDNVGGGTGVYGEDFEYPLIILDEPNGEDYGWRPGVDEYQGYIFCKVNSGFTQPTPDSLNNGKVGFWGTVIYADWPYFYNPTGGTWSPFTNESFVNVACNITGTDPTDKQVDDMIPILWDNEVWTSRTGTSMDLLPDANWGTGFTGAGSIETELITFNDIGSPICLDILISPDLVANTQFEYIVNDVPTNMTGGKYLLNILPGQRFKLKLSNNTVSTIEHNIKLTNMSDGTLIGITYKEFEMTCNP